MHNFLANNRDELINRCKQKVAQRPFRAATDKQLSHGVPIFLDQLIRTLAAEYNDEQDVSVVISGPSGGDAGAFSEIGLTATVHGKELLDLNYSLDQVVHDYGDLCQAITDLAFERNEPFSVGEFRTLNRCLDNGIANAVSEFSVLRDANMAQQHSDNETQHLGFLAHELRNALATAMNVVSALELSNMPIAGALGAVLKRSHTTLSLVIDQALTKVREDRPVERQTFSVASFIGEAAVAARLNADVRGCSLAVNDVNPMMEISGNKELLHGALANLLQNAFKFTKANTVVSLNAFVSEKFVLINVADHCGGLPPEGVVKMFAPFQQHAENRSGLGLGLTIARQNVEADDGTLTVRNVPGTGCVFTIRLPLYISTSP